VQRTSETIATLAAALAKAQIELVNPEKTLVATIRTGDRGDAERAFRYASLSSGLEIVRKILGRHEIATVQTTSIDQTDGVIKLTTLLAHSSGEWIASDWPVCPISETATPRRMGEALTYARRYALFTLVGIAGEDDLDAPDLVGPTPRSSSSDKTKSQDGSQLNGGQQTSLAHLSPRYYKATQQKYLNPALGTNASEELRVRLIAELDQLGSGEEAAIWAQHSLGEKNRLTAMDAQIVEKAFEVKLTTFGTDSNPPSTSTGLPSADVPDVAPSSSSALSSSSNLTAERNLQPARRIARKQAAKKSRKVPSQPAAIDKSSLTFPEPRRVRDRDHVRFVASQPCLICGRRPSDAHHLRFTQSRALSRKVSDEFTVPLCRGHHREIHRFGDEATWWKRTKLDPIAAARTLWLRTHPSARTDSDPNIDKLTPSPISQAATVNLPSHVTENELASPHRDSQAN
jgi:hypothetical protein